MLDAPKNIGTNQWVTTSGSELEITDSYVYSVRSRGYATQLQAY